MAQKRENSVYIYHIWFNVWFKMELKYTEFSVLRKYLQYAVYTPNSVMQTFNVTSSAFSKTNLQLIWYKTVVNLIQHFAQLNLWAF